VYVGGRLKPVGCNVLFRKKTNDAIYIYIYTNNDALDHVQITCVAIILSYNIN